jgi:alkanesulfonate monooxygenase SsuD/methylene tetrahydromethanopterin reductase-like flavin-dependent oxidoreductase (luciferase family)
VRRGLYLAPFDELADARLLAELAAAAEVAGWEGVFLWDHILWDPPTRAVVDPWVAMTAMALATERVRLGAMVTPLARRRPAKLARETATLDVLSGGRLTVGIGLGGDRGGEFSRFGEELDPKARAVLLDERLATLQGLWEEFEPRPVQRPRIPVWAGMKWPHRRPLKRAARLDGVFPVDVDTPGDLRDLLDALGPVGPDYDVVITQAPGTDPAPWEAAGATWLLTGFGPAPRRAEVETVAGAAPVA